MKVNHIKQLFVALFLLLSAGTATAAQWHLAKTTLNAAGSKDTLTLEVSGNSFSFSSFQVDFTLPDGVLLDGTPILGELTDGHALTWTKRDDGSFRCVAYSAKNTEMKAPVGTVIRIPVVLAASFTGGAFTAKNGILSNKKSVAQSVTDLSETLRSYKERANLVVNVSGLEQKVNPNAPAPAELSYTTIPSGKALTVGYFKDDSCKVAATDEDRKKEGILYVKLSYKGDADYAPFEQVYVMSLTSKKAIAAKDIVAPVAEKIKAGQLLSASLLTGGSVKDGDYTVAGTFAWTNGNVVVPAGKQSYSATFYPDNSSYYNTAEVSVEVDVTPTYLVTAVATTGGVVNVLGKTEDNVYVKDQEIKLIAVPQPNYKFESWSVMGSDETLARKDTIAVKTDKAKTYTANFTPILHEVSIEKKGNGNISVTVEGTSVENGTSLQQGTVLRILAGPDPNSQLKSLTVNGKALEGDKVTLTETLNILAEFEVKPVNMALVTIENAKNGSILLYKEDGSLIASGSTVPVGAKVRAVALPDAGYQLNGSVSFKVKGSTDVEGSTDGLYTVTRDVEAKATFGAKRYMVKSSAVSSNPNETTPSGTITLDLSGEQPYGTEVRITSIEGQNGARLLTILANGKEISRNDVLTVTGDLTVTAVFDHRVAINREYILWPYQEYYYNGVSRNFVPFASQTYAGFSFDVSYITSEGKEIAKAIDADDYTVVLKRAEDGLYEAFEAKYPESKNEGGKEGLKIKKSKVSVTEAPTGEGNLKTRPAEVTITKTTKDGVTTYKIEPTGNAAKNYEGTTYYHSTNPAVKMSFGTSILRSGGEPEGYVRVTNGGMPYDATNGEISIPGGITVMLEAVPAEGFKFSHWSDDATNTNPQREYVVTAGAEGVTPVFAGKADPTYSLASSSSEYNGAAQLVSVTGTGSEACQITFFFDEACQQPAVLKNAGKYYVRVYRPADADSKEYTKVFPYTIGQATPEVTPPTASDILSGQKLSESRLLGGEAGIVAGTFAWSDPDQVITEKGEQEVVFTPTDPNYKPVTGKVEVNVVSATSSSTDPETPVTPVDPENPDVPTGVESIEDGLSLYTANQSIFVNTPQQVTLTVVDVAGSVIYEGKVQGEVEIPVGHTGVYFLKCVAVPDTSFVKKIVVR
ncbi:T9SS type A sorting domain-containing protein [Parabacteroides distasonis]|uniref:T9SS type A sorting domain-containing protein n=1 Tax=Parabacteroides distasonis TaxID=823 RepID=UPI00189A9907|nr:T9SS type A sorting domain-containing protein [Parabacteroides distasonis]